jgi:hypothetical protein
LPIVTGAAGTVYRLSRIARALPALWGRSGAIVSRLVFGFPPFAQAAAKARRETFLTDFFNTAYAFC